MQPAAGSSEGLAVTFDGSDMVLSRRLKQCKRREPFDDLGAGLRAREALQQFM